MRCTAKLRFLLTTTATVAMLAGAVATAVPAEATDWNMPRKNIQYTSHPQCTTRMSLFESGYGKRTCKGYYVVNRRNYLFAQHNTHACPALGNVQRITLDYVLNPASGGVTSNSVLAGFSMHW